MPQSRSKILFPAIGWAREAGKGGQTAYEYLEMVLQEDFKAYKMNGPIAKR